MTVPKRSGRSQVASSQSTSNSNSQLAKSNLPPWLPNGMASLFIFIRCILSRLIFMGCTLWIILQTVKLKEEKIFYNFALVLLLQLAEVLLFAQTVITTPNFFNSPEKWFNICTFIFLICTWPPMVIMEFHFQKILNDTKPPEKNTYKENYCTPLEFEQKYALGYKETPYGPQLSFSKIEQTYLLCAVIGSCLVSHKSIKVHNLAGWMFVQVCHAADMLELVQYMQHKDLCRKISLTRSIIGLLHIGQLQLCFSRTKESRGRSRGSQLAEIICPLMLLDVPFFFLRLKLHYSYKYSNFQVVFYIIKNIGFILVTLIDATLVVVYKK